MTLKLALFDPDNLSAENQKGAIAAQLCSIENQKGAIAAQLCSIENQKGAIAAQLCSIDNQKGAITIDFVCTVISPFWFSTEYL